MSTIKQLQNDPYKLYAAKVAKVESGNNPNAKNPYSSASGLFQFTDGTWKGVSDRYKLGYTQEDKFDPKKSQRAFELFTKDNAAYIEPTLGHTPTDADLYMAHFLGSGGANTFFKAYNQNPNTSITQVVSPAVIAANKSVMLNKDGTPKNLQQVYGWAQQKMDITPDNITVTQSLTDYEIPNPFANFETSQANLQSLPEIEKKETDKEVVQAQKELEEKTNEYNFIQDYLNQRQQPLQQHTQIQPSQAIETPDVLNQYAEVSAFVQNPIMQNGGTIPVSQKGLWEYPNQKVVVPTEGSITMSQINYPVLGKSLETGEQKIMLPNLEYYFNNTKNVLEIPLK